MERSTPSGRLVTSLDREPITPLIFRMLIVTLDPVGRDGVHFSSLIEFLPEVQIEHRLVLGPLPAPPLPAIHPFRQPLDDVLAVGIEIDPGRAREAPKTLDDRQQLHPIVGGGRVPAIFHSFLPIGKRPQNEGPTPRSGVPGTGSVRKKSH